MCFNSVCYTQRFMLRFSPFSEMKSRAGQQMKGEVCDEFCDAWIFLLLFWTILILHG